MSTSANCAASWKTRATSCSPRRGLTRTCSGLTDEQRDGEAGEQRGHWLRAAVYPFFRKCVVVSAFGQDELSLAPGALAERRELALLHQPGEQARRHRHDRRIAAG